LWCKVEKPKPEAEKLAIKACEDKEEKDKCWYSLKPGGDALKGWCMTAEQGDKKVLWCKVEKPKPEAEKLAIKACEDKEEKDKCWYSLKPGGKALKGWCMTAEQGDKKVLWCKVEKPKPEAEKLAMKACEGKEEKDKCWYSLKPGGDALKGWCMTAEQGDKKVLWCKVEKPQPEPEKPVIKACEGKEEKDKCWVSFKPGGEAFKGWCMWADQGDKKVLWCKVEKPKPDLKACEGKEEGDDCEYTFAKMIRKGKCMSKEKSDKSPLWCMSKPTPRPPSGETRRRRRRRRSSAN